MKEIQGLRLIQGLRDNRESSARVAAAVSTTALAEDPVLNHLLDAPKTVLPAALEAAEERLKDLLEDRTRIGRDLHDCILQSLYAIGLMLETGRRTHVDPQTLKIHEHVVDQLNQLIHETRKMIRRIEDGVLQSFNLMEELEALTHNYEQIGGLKFTLQIQSRALQALTQEEHQELFNIVREAVSNCVRHAKASHATIKLQRSQAKVRLAIVDDGIGFDSNALPASGYGLHNMVARAHKIGGTLQVRSEKNRGTQVIAEFPLEPVLTST